MTEPELTHAVLHRLSTFVRSLSAEELADLATGAARLQLAPAEGGGAAPKGGRDLPVAADVVRATLSAMLDRNEAGRYVDGLRLTGPQLRDLARALGLAVSASAAKAQVRDTIVQWTVGRRVDATILSRS